MVGQGKHKGFLVLLVARKKRAWVNEQRTAPVVNADGQQQFLTEAAEHEFPTLLRRSKWPLT